jgi:hypothetical protein
MFAWRKRTPLKKFFDTKGAGNPESATTGLLGPKELKSPLFEATRAGRKSGESGSLWDGERIYRGRHCHDLFPANYSFDESPRLPAGLVLQQRLSGICQKIAAEIYKAALQS